MDWLSNINDDRTLDRMFYVFGHSPGITDKDITGSFVTANDMRMMLFYRSDDTFSDQVSNLTAIIGAGEMVAGPAGRRTP